MNTKTVKIMAAAIAGGLFLCGCTSTYQNRSVSGSGFLSDYSQLKDRGGDTAMLSYVDPTADFRLYDKIMIDPIRAYAKDKDSSMAKMSKEDQQGLLNYFDATLREQLKSNYTLVSQSGPGVLRLRVAITEAKGSKVVMDTMSSVMPPAIVLGAAKKIITGSNLAVGSIGAECEGVDSLTGKRLFAAVDARAGRKYTGKFDKFSKWHAANDAMDFWAEQLRARLASERAATGR
jgi:hypothetical protein